MCFFIGGVDSSERGDMDLLLSHLHLPNMGLMLTHWRYKPNLEPSIRATSLKGADLTLDKSTGLHTTYPMTEMDFTLVYKGNSIYLGL